MAGMKTLMPVALLAALTFGCTGETAPEGGEPQTPPAVTTVIETPEIHDAICGCALPDVGRCGNYVKIDDRYVVIEWPELGKMEWCERGKDGARIEITGAMDGDKFVAKSYRQVD